MSERQPTTADMAWLEGEAARTSDRKSSNSAQRVLVALRGRQQRLDRIASIIEGVDNRCAASDGPVTPTLQEMTQQEIAAIYAFAVGRNS